MNLYYKDNSIVLYHGDCREVLKSLPDCSVHCCVTSPPYWGLRSYNGGDAELGKEETPEEYVAQMVDVFREVRRILRDDGVLFLNLGDSYYNYRPGKGQALVKQSCASNDQDLPQTCARRGNKLDGLKEKDLVGIPWRVAFALQADGFYLRQDIIWHKINPMPESVKDRCCKSHEYLFLLTKSTRYFYDSEAIKEPASTGYNGSEFHTGKTGDHQLGRASKQPRFGGTKYGDSDDPKYATKSGNEYAPNGFRTKRSVWTVATQPFSGAHFATFPPALITPCILAGTSERGCCPKCGTPWERCVESKRVMRHELSKDNPNYRPGRYTVKSGGQDDYAKGGGQAFSESRTTGWRPGCSCNEMGCSTDDPAYYPYDPVPCTVLDPFNGAGTTGYVAKQLGKKYIGIDLNKEYLDLSIKRVEQETLPLGV